MSWSKPSPKRTPVRTPSSTCDVRPTAISALTPAAVSSRGATGTWPPPSPKSNAKSPAGSVRGRSTHGGAARASGAEWSTASAEARARSPDRSTRIASASAYRSRRAMTRDPARLLQRDYHAPRRRRRRRQIGPVPISRAVPVASSEPVSVPSRAPASTASEPTAACGNRRGFADDLRPDPGGLPSLSHFPDTAGSARQSILAACSNAFAMSSRLVGCRPGVT